MTPRTWAVIATKRREGYGNSIMAQCMAAILPQVDGIVVIDNNTWYQNDIDEFGGDKLIHIYNPPDRNVPERLYVPNLSAMLNTGIDTATPVDDAEWNVVLLNDDVVVPTGWVDVLSTNLRSGSYAAAHINWAPRPNWLTCWACMIRGEAKLRWDEELLWWYGDGAFEIECKTHGGIIAVPGECPDHLFPDHQTMRSTALSQQAHRDAETFRRKYGG